MSFSPFFSDRQLIINTGISVVDCVCFNVRNTSTPSISGTSMSRRIMLGLQLSAAKGPVLPSQAMRTRSPKPSSTREYACAINLLSSTIKTTSLLNKGHRPHLPLHRTAKRDPVPTGPKKFRENGEGRPEGWFAALYPRTSPLGTHTRETTIATRGKSIMPWYKKPKRRGSSPRLLEGLRHRDLLLRLSQPVGLSPDPILEA